MSERSDEQLRYELRQRIEHDIRYHEPNDRAAGHHEGIRQAVQRCAATFIALCPPSRELSLALTKLVDEAMAHANAAVARNHDRL